VTLDRVEREIILLLQQDGRMPYVEMAQRTGVSEGTIRRKFNRLKEEGVINIVGVANPFKIGFNTVAIIGLRVQQKMLEQAATKLSSMPAVRYVAVSTGTHDIIIQVCLEDNQQLSDFLLRQLPEVEGIIASDTSVVLKIYKQTYDWGVPLRGVS